MISGDADKIKKILAIYDNFHLDLQKLKDEYFALLKQQNEEASQVEIEKLRQQIQNL